MLAIKPMPLPPIARSLLTLYSSAMLSGMSAMLVPTIPVLAKSFAITPGTAAQLITALSIGDRKSVV